MESELQRNAKQSKLQAPLAVIANDGVLPTDVLHQVLLRLPAKVLCRFRLVCRSWRSLTSDPTFAKAHLRCRPLAVGLRALPYTDSPGPRHSSREVQFVDVHFGDIVKRIPTRLPWACHDLMGTQFGLLCVTDTQDKGTLLNASTSAVVTSLPSSTTAAEYENQSNFHRSVSMSILGQVPSTGECKLLRIHRHERDYRVEQTCEVITLGGRGRVGDDGRWRVRPRPPVLVSMATMQRAVSGGIVYFLLAPHRDDNNVKDEIASFDLATEEWSHGTLTGPVGGRLASDINDGDVIIVREFYLANLDGCLVAICRYITRSTNGYYYYDDHDYRCSMDLWFLMNADKGLWTK